jgi:cytochrome c55X
MRWRWVGALAAPPRAGWPRAALAALVALSNTAISNTALASGTLAVNLAGLPTIAHAQASAPAPAAPPDATSIEAGRKVYVLSCQRCHGINLVSNGIGFDLRTFPQDDKERFIRSVNNGLRAMPAWSGTLKPGQLDLLWAYIGSVNGWN